MSQDSTISVAPTAAPTAKDGLFFLTILMNMTNKPEVDWNLVAAEAGFKNAKVARTRFGQMKKKLIPSGQGTPTTQSPNASFSSTASVPSKPRTPNGSPSKKVKKEVGSGTNINSSGVRKSPVKGNAMSRAQNALNRGWQGEAEEDEDEIALRGNRSNVVKYEDGGEDFMIEEY